MTWKEGFTDKVNIYIYMFFKHTVSLFNWLTTLKNICNYRQSISAQNMLLKPCIFDRRRCICNQRIAVRFPQRVKDFNFIDLRTGFPIPNNISILGCFHIPGVSMNFWFGKKARILNFQTEGSPIPSRMSVSRHFVNS